MGGFVGGSVRRFIRKAGTVKPGFNEAPRDWGYSLVISKFRYIEVLFYTLHYCWTEKYRLLYRGHRYVEDH